jgi:hypothetical protein
MSVPTSIKEVIIMVNFIKELNWKSSYLRHSFSACYYPSFPLDLIKNIPIIKNNPIVAAIKT